jgi:poly(A) polymerase
VSFLFESIHPSQVLNPSDADERYDAFLRTVRVLRLWAKRRCLYSNKMGYLGGINFNIMLTMVIQFYPRKSPGCLLAKFFETLALWERKILTVPEVSEAEARHSGVLWRHPVRLCAELRGVAQRLDKEVYPETSFGVNWGAMPVVTPSYPAYNSTGNVNPWT